LSLTGDTVGKVQKGGGSVVVLIDVDVVCDGVVNVVDVVVVLVAAV
jgi:hypothetical protein